MSRMRQFSKLRDLLLSKSNMIKIYYHSKVWFLVIREVGKESHVFDNLWNELDSSLHLLVFITYPCDSQWIRNTWLCFYNKIYLKIRENHSWITLSKLLIVTRLTFVASIFLTLSLSKWENARATCLGYFLKSIYYFGVLSIMFKKFVYKIDFAI